MRLILRSNKLFVHVFAVTLVVATLVMPLLPAATEAHSIRAAADNALDLAAIAISPLDIEHEGNFGYGLASVGLESSGWQTLGDVVEESVAANKPGDVVSLSRLNFEFGQTGWKRQYRRVLARPDMADPTHVSFSITSEIAEYADAEGADAALTMLMDGGEEQEIGGDVIGDRTEIRHDVMPDAGAVVYVKFRTGNLIGGVRVITWGDTHKESPYLALELSRILLERIEEAIADPRPGLSDLLLSIESVSSPAEFETYWRFDGETFADYNGTPEDLEAASAAYDPAIAVYQKMYRPVAAGAFVLPQLVVRVLRFSDESTASEWLEALPAHLAEDVANSGGELTLEPVDDADTIGDESQAYAVEYANDGSPTVGYRFYLRVGADVARLQFDAPWDPEFEAVEFLAEAQADCLEAGGCDGAVQLPDSLAEHACSTSVTSENLRKSLATNSRTPGLEAIGAHYAPAEPAVNWQVQAPGLGAAPPLAGDGNLYFKSLELDPADEWLRTIYAVDALTGEPLWCTVTGEVAGGLAVADGLVLTVGAEVTGGMYQPFVVALSSEYGVEEWRFSIGWPVDSFTPGLTVADDIIYVTTGLGAVYALDVFSGDPLWMYQTDEDASFSDMELSSAAIAGDLVFVSGGTSLLALDAQTGELSWSLEAGSGDEDLGSPTTDGETVYVGGTDAVYAVDAATGEVNWEFEVESEGIATTSLVHDMLFFSTGTEWEPETASSIYALDAISGEELWRVDGDGYLSAPAVEGETIYATDRYEGALIALSGSDGDLLWSAQLEVGSYAPLIVDGLLYIGATVEDGVTVLALTPDGGDVVSSHAHSRDPRE